MLSLIPDKDVLCLTHIPPPVDQLLTLGDPRDRIRQADVHLLEIDFLRRGTRVWEYDGMPGNVPYLIVLTRSGARRMEAMSNIALREHAASFLFKAYAGLLASTVLIIFLQGFQLWGFQLDAGFLNWLGAATIGEVAGLAALVYGALFKKSS